MYIPYNTFKYNTAVFKIHEAFNVMRKINNKALMKIIVSLFFMFSLFNLENFPWFRLTYFFFVNSTYICCCHARNSCYFIYLSICGNYVDFNNERKNLILFCMQTIFLNKESKRKCKKCFLHWCINRLVG